MPFKAKLAPTKDIGCYPNFVHLFVFRFRKFQKNLLFLLTVDYTLKSNDLLSNFLYQWKWKQEMNNIEEYVIKICLPKNVIIHTFDHVCLSAFRLGCIPLWVKDHFQDQHLRMLSLSV